MSLSESIYGILFEPILTLRHLSQQKPYARGLLLFLAVMLSGMLFEQSLNVYNSNQVLNMIPAQAIWVLNATGALGAMFFLFIFSGLLSLISEIIYGKFNAGGILVVLCFASVPGILGPPLQYAALLAGINWLGVLLSGLAMVWVLVLQVIGLREALNVTTGQAVLVMIFPIIFFMLIAAGLVALAAVSMAV